jgi:hypothetical protein
MMQKKLLASIGSTVLLMSQLNGMDDTSEVEAFKHNHTLHAHSRVAHSRVKIPSLESRGES